MSSFADVHVQEVGTVSFICKPADTEETDQLQNTRISRSQNCILFRNLNGDANNKGEGRQLDQALF